MIDRGRVWHSWALQSTRGRRGPKSIHLSMQYHSIDSPTEVSKVRQKVATGPMPIVNNGLKLGSILLWGHMELSRASTGIESLPEQGEKKQVGNIKEKKKW